MGAVRFSLAVDNFIISIRSSRAVHTVELCALTAGDVDQVRGLVWVRAGKGNKARAVPCTLCSRLLALSPAGAASSVFGLTGWGVYCLFSRLSARAGVRISPHQLRHYFATHYDGDIQDIQIILGHADIATTARVYRHRLVDHLLPLHLARSPLKRL